jgi:GntR family transcriptional regulator
MSEFKPVIRDGIRRLGSETWPVGRSLWSPDIEGRTLAVDRIEVAVTSSVPDGIRAVLGLQPGEGAVVRTRRYLLDGKPVMTARSWLPASLSAGTAITERDTGPGGVYARLAELGHAPVRFREDLRAAVPGPDVANSLGILPGTPVVEVIRTAYDESGAAIEVNEMAADGSAYIFRYEFGT